jgi:alkylation response protein AidB-like acyl-CoA dehydrogenase
MSAVPDHAAAQRALVHAARDLIPTLRAHGAAIDQARSMPPPVLDGMRSAGVFRMFVPCALGGAQVDLQTFVEIVEAVAEGDGAAGWNAASNAVVVMRALTLPDAGIAAIYGHGPDVILAGRSELRDGAANAVDGGYRVTGRWRFGSGCTEAAWMAGGCQVFAGGFPRHGPDGAAEYRHVFFPKTACAIIDTWRVVGLRGTGSHDWAVDDVYVPEHLTQRAGVPLPWTGTLYALPQGSIGAVHFTAVATGIARAAITTLTELAGQKVPYLAAGLLRERRLVQEAVGRAETILEAGRAYRARMVAEIWAAAEAGAPVTAAQRTRLKLAGTYAVESAVRAVDLMYGAGGTTAIEDASPLSRCFRDVHVVAQNFTVSPQNYEVGGRVLLGMDADGTRPEPAG